jgi:hypothetical protein
VPAPTQYLERTRGRILAESERIRVASRVQLLGKAKGLEKRSRGGLLLALTDRRLLVVTKAIRVSRARLLSEWPTGELRIKVTRRKLGNNLIHIVPVDGLDLSFEWINGNRPQEWANYRYRQ